MGAFIDLTGKVFNKLTVISRVGVNKHGGILWNCLCECGKEKIVNGDYLKNGDTKSCGCIFKEGNNNKTHGLTKTLEYKSWCHMKERCLNSKNKKYKHYGARGIIVCDKWLHSFENFLKDMGKRPSEKHSIDRIDVNGNYCKENCRWATPKEQANNTRKNIKIINTETNEIYPSIAEAARSIHMNTVTLGYQLKEKYKNKTNFKIFNN